MEPRIYLAGSLRDLAWRAIDRGIGNAIVICPSLKQGLMANLKLDKDHIFLNA
jgi:hypothetical protein